MAIFRAFGKTLRLFRLVAFVRLLGAQESLLPPDFHRQAPLMLRVLRRVLIIGAMRFDDAKKDGNQKRGKTLSDKLQKLGSIYIKLGQSLATRPDIIGAEMAADLQHLQDQLPPFDDTEVQRILTDELDVPRDEYFTKFSAPIAAASIAQVHRATLKDGTDVAVKLLRPNIAQKLNAELEVFFWVAKWVEKLMPASRRIRPVAGVQALADSVKLELDLRLEAAALSEMSENIHADEKFRVPEVVWSGTGRRMLTMHWVDGVKLSDIAGLKKVGHDLPDLAQRLLQNFLTHALRDGFFHGDMHQGNLLVEDNGHLVAIDLGIMGRLDQDSRRFLAEIIYGFITRDYQKLAEVHFEAGYVKDDKNKEAFAQALRAIGEPISGQGADDISMAKLLAQLFDVTEQFDMEAQPQLLLLQKTMVVTEGVARSLDPKLNIWAIAEPVVSKWLKTEIGPEAILKDALGGLRGLQKSAKQLAALPDTLALATRNQQALAEILTPEGLKLHPDMRPNPKIRQVFWGLILLVLSGILGMLIFGNLV